MNRLLITGASGPIGRALLPSFDSKTTEIVRLVRGPAKNAGEVSWNPQAELSPQVVARFDTVIHLAGESVMGRWTEGKKKAIREAISMSLMR